MIKRSKAYKSFFEKIEKDKLYSVKEALNLILDNTKKEGTVEVAIKLGVDPRKVDQMIRGSVILPNGTGKTQKVAVFAVGTNVDIANSAGADIVGGDDLISKIKNGFLDFDTVVATPDMMGKVGRIGKILGPRNLMPNPKTGTVTTDIEKAIKDIKSGKISFKTDKHGNLHFIIGKTKFSADNLVANFSATMEELKRLKPTSLKGSLYIKKISISTTFGPSISIDYNS